MRARHRLFGFAVTTIRDYGLSASLGALSLPRVAARPQLEAALLRCRQTRATLLVAKLDRLSRNIAFLFRMRDEGVKFQAIDMPEANTLTLGVFAAMAQHEREIISARTKAALAARRARGLSLGSPRDLSAYAIAAAAAGRASLLAKAKKHAEEIIPQIVAARAEGRTSLRQVAAWLTTKASLRIEASIGPPPQFATRSG
jgi:DNA invertase Pin-like site-specific DNA recombinase